MTAAPVLAPWNREHGILFTAEMVRAILDNRKRDTRRLSCRYQVGDLLYVKETWAAFRQTSIVYNEWEQVVSPLNGSWADEYETRGPMVVEYRADFEPRYGAWERTLRDRKIQRIERWQSPLHMPKRHARIWLEVTGVRKERLQDITEEGARAEGVEPVTHHVHGAPVQRWRDYARRPGDITTAYSSAAGSFESLWESIHGPGAWASNPEVSVIEFRRVK